MMTKIFITGSTDGLGFLAAKRLINEGNEVVLHARNQQRAEEVMFKLPQAKNVVVGDLSSQTETKNLAKQINDLGSFDTIIHNCWGRYKKSRINIPGKCARTIFINVTSQEA